MKANEKRNILILLVVTILIIGLLFMLKNNKAKKEENKDVQNQISSETQNFKELSSGNKLNISEKLAEKKYFGSYEVSNIQLTQKDGKTELYANVKNIGNTKLGFTSVNIVFYDKEGKEIATVKDVLIGEVEAGKTTRLNVKATLNSINAYDFSLSII